MARKRASMREGPLADLFRATEAAQRASQAAGEGDAPEEAPAPEDAQTQLLPPDPEPEPPRAALEETVEHVYDFGADEETAVVPPPAPVEAHAEVAPEPEPEPAPAPAEVAERAAEVERGDARARRHR